MKLCERWALFAVTVQHPHLYYWAILLAALKLAMLKQCEKFLGCFQ